MKAKAVSALRERGMRCRCGAEPQGCEPQFKQQERKADTMKGYLLRKPKAVESQKTPRPLRRETGHDIAWRHPRELTCSSRLCHRRRTESSLMKLASTFCTACLALAALGNTAHAEENSGGINPPLSQTDISGYVNTSGEWNLGDAAAVPEPSVILLAACAVGLASLPRWRRTRS